MGSLRIVVLYDRVLVDDAEEQAAPADKTPVVRTLDKKEVEEEVTEALTSSSTGVRCDLVVMDTAPSGHALRLLETPAVVHEWVKTLMAILLKYQALGAIGNVGAVLVRLSRGLRRLRALLVDADATRFIPVVRPAALPREETMRLLHHLRGARISAPVVVVNETFARVFAREGRVMRGRPFVLSGFDTVREIVGIAGDVQQTDSGFQFNGRMPGPVMATPTVYLPVTQVPASFLTGVHTWFRPVWTVRPRQGTRAAGEVARAIARVDPLLPVSPESTIDAVIAAVMLTLRRRPGAKHQSPSAQARVRAADRVRVIKMDAVKPVAPAPVETPAEEGKP